MIPEYLKILNNQLLYEYILKDIKYDTKL